MAKQILDGAAKRATFGRRKIVPHACVVDCEQHLRVDVVEALQELGFVTGECKLIAELGAALDAHVPDLVVLGLWADAVDANEKLKLLAAKHFGGMVLLLGPTSSTIASGIGEFGEKLGLTMLPTLPTPFGSGNLRESVAILLPPEAPKPSVDIAEALHAGWMDLWYQPQFDARTLSLRGAEALIRMRHPYWGIVQPGCFLPSADDPDFRALSEFVIDQAVVDWHYFLTEQKQLDISINLAVSFLKIPGSVEYLCQRLPHHSAFEGLLVEIDGSEIVGNLSLTQDLARQVRFHKIAISIDDLHEEWPLLVGLKEFPFVQIKVDRRFVSGCADDEKKRSMCRRILQLADDNGARTVAEGVETRADFLAVREMGFDLIQGFLFGKPMSVRKFARTILRQPVEMVQRNFERPCSPTHSRATGCRNHHSEQ